MYSLLFTLPVVFSMHKFSAIFFMSIQNKDEVTIGNYLDM